MQEDSDEQEEHEMETARQFALGLLPLITLVTIPMAPFMDVITARPIRLPCRSACLL